jgi:hypothetical protein
MKIDLQRIAAGAKRRLALPMTQYIGRPLNPPNNTGLSPWGQNFKDRRSLDRGSGHRKRS